MLYFFAVTRMKINRHTTKLNVINTIKPRRMEI